MKPLVVLCCVGLTPRHLRDHGAALPHLSALAAKGFHRPLTSALPAVTTTAQTTMLTGVMPRNHGIVGNGWYFRDQGEIWLWRQSEKLVQAPHLWEGTPLKVLKHFWWYAMNTSAAACVTPRPAYHHDGRKSPDVYTWPPELKSALNAAHGTFPLFNFWGPLADLRSSRWIADSFATAWQATRPDLGLCYLPHLDYDLQRFGPTGDHLTRNLAELDACAGTVIAAAQTVGAGVLVVSEYGLAPVQQAAFPNRTLREAGLLAVTRNATGELLDPGMSRAFAVCDHQLAHVYIQHPGDISAARAALAQLPGVERVFAGDERDELGLGHSRSGELVLMAAPGWWFAHDYWRDDRHRPDFAQAVEIHKKPGYDPRELLFDPHGGKLRAGLALLRKKLGLRYNLNPCPLDTALVKGSHGRPAAEPLDGPVLICDRRDLERDGWHQTDIAGLIRTCLS